jgi:hypothetical protein
MMEKSQFWEARREKRVINYANLIEFKLIQLFFNVTILGSGVPGKIK